ncbi:hypothetical protein GGS20DRAFT_547483 [Poronia punctata]|nr:hypothetical protein GGS20DRAFT_547483 [Poronia punctata]
MTGRPRGGERGGRGARSTRGRGASSSSTTASGPSLNDPVPSEATMPKNETGAGTISEAAPAAAASSTSVGSRSSQTPAASSKSGPRFRPKNVRRDEAERKRLEEARNSELLSKIKAEEREQRQEERRARRGRGRGGMPRGGLIRRTVTATGPFSGIASENVKSDSGSGGWASGSGSGFGGGHGRSSYRHDPENSLRYQPRREHEARINIDLLNGQTDGHSPDGAPLYQPTRYAQKSVGHLPVGMSRTLHQDPEIKVKTQAELEAEDRQSSDDEGNLFVDGPAIDPRDIVMKDDNAVWHAAPKKVTVKAEPGTEEDEADLDLTNIPEAPKAPLSPEMKRKPVIDEDGVATEAAAAAAEKAKRKEKKIAEDPEFMHLTSDLEALLNTLSLKPPAEGEEGQEKDDQLFIFQLPPILPSLGKRSDKSGQGADATDPFATDDATSRIKGEDGAEAARAKSNLPPEGGYIGRLNVHKSGKVELDWGGTALNVGLATETDFLTTAMVIEQKENVETAEESAGFAFGMGQVFGGFVLAPIFEEEDDWDPDISEIMAGVGNGNST